MNSMRNKLLLWLGLGLFSIIVAAGVGLYFQARGEANQIFDYQMRQIAASLPRQAFSPISPGQQLPELEDEIMMQIWDSSGTVIYHSHARGAMPRQAELGFVNVHGPNGMWRVYSAQVGSTVVQVAQPQSARDEIAAQMAVKTVAPLFLLFPLIGILAWLAVSRGLAPVRRAAAEVQARDMNSLMPIADVGLPQEIQPLTHALNDLLARLKQSTEAQRAFVADAAHELRTPLTALRLQAQLAERAADEGERKAAFADLKNGLERATHLVHQLLTLARQEPDAMRFAPVDLRELLRGVVADLSSVASDGDIDLGLSGEDGDGGPLMVSGNADALRILFNNLVDNALRYTPAGGVVDVSLAMPEQGKCAVLIQDSGPGIAESEMPRVFDRFYRARRPQEQSAGRAAFGSGLGLAIVRQIADLHRVPVELNNTGKGLQARVTFALLP
ncbi:MULTISPECIES: ATP-binding protein [unclassified Herbaspirillum]|uniref:ATP-binding protein n=1 Tax=unclassified Herbaspirillum TaxID=2624150 RepID=UPI0011505FAA|nr:MULTISPECIES: ATP-binding protein [unclassified Herbaspirillum]MBB5390115.1 signal transduction histidine kinase [Herbaspirillum sp. SJZ102]TQK09386.1 two-component system OmpR family sensor kinase [Herbaspirillum sp. SJZ130]TQK13927.1 two-component system OmpR family sensor kinase [Herbaspirillum sp. SJZ106]